MSGGIEIVLCSRRGVLGLGPVVADRNDYLEAEVRDFIPTRGTPHHVDPDLVVAALGEDALEFGSRPRSR